MHFRSAPHQAGQKRLVVLDKQMLCGETMLEGLAESHRKRRVTTDKSDHSKETPPDLETLNPDDWEWSSSSVSFSD